MYNTSKGYKEKILEDSTQHELNIYIDENKIEPNHIIDFSSKSELFNNNELCLGCTPEKDIEFEIDKRDLPENYNEVYVETGIKYHNDIVTEGEEITLKEEKEIPLNLEISGNHKQETYSGKNILNFGASKSGTINGITYSYDENTQIWTVNGTATAKADVHFGSIIKSEANKVYQLETFHLGGSISSDKCMIYMQDENQNWTGWSCQLLNVDARQPATKDKNLSMGLLIFRIESGTTLNNYKFKAQFEQTDNPTVVEWEPYVGEIPAPNPDYTSEIKTVGSNINLFNAYSSDLSYYLRNTDKEKYTINNSNSIKVEGTGVSWNRVEITISNLKPNTKYTITSQITNITQGWAGLLCDYDNNNIFKVSNKEQSNPQITIITDENGKVKLQFFTNYTSTVQNSSAIFDDIKLVEGTEVGEYSKYGQRSVKVTKCNKNLVGDIQKGYWNNTGVFEYDTNFVSSKQIKVEKGKTYIGGLFDKNKNYVGKVVYVLFDKNKNFSRYSGEEIITIGNNEEYVSIRTYSAQASYITSNNYLLQLEVGNKISSYEPHQEQSYILPVQQEMLEGDYFDWDNEEEVHVWEKLVFKGNENWSLDDIYNGIAQFSLSVNAVYINDYDTVIRTMSNYFKGVGFDSSWLIDNCVTIRKHSRVRIMISKYTTVEQFKTWLKSKYDEGTPVIVYYKLSTPKRLPFTEEQKEIAKELSRATTYEGTTHIYSTDSISPVLKTTCGSEIVPIGKFTIQKPIEDDEFKVKIKATDYMKKFEDNKYDGSNLTYPKTMLEVLKDICEKVGVELGSTSFLNSNKQIAVYDNTVTARTYLGYIAEQAGGFAVIGRDGKLYIKTFGEDTINFNVDLFGDFTWGDKLKVSRVSYEDGIQNYKFGDETQATVFIDQNNMYIVDSEQVENIYNQIKDFEVYTFEGETIIDPAYDIGDILVIDGKKVLYQGEIKYAGKFKASINNKVQAKTEQESMQTKQTNSNKIKRVQSEINQIDGKITQLVQETTENEEKITQAQQDIDGFTQKVATKDELTEKVNELKHTIEGITLQSKETGGGNIFFYAKEYWRGQEQDSEATLEEYTNTLIQQNNVSDEGYLINNGVSIQSQVVKNGQYVISFNYYKLKEDATGYVKVNEVEYKLDGNINTWIEKIIPVEITSNNIKIEIGSDTVASYYISDLMVSMGVEKNIWTQNANETRTDTVEIGKGIQVNSSTKNTYTRIDADGNRTFNSSTNERVAEMTDKGVYTKQLEVKEQAKINVLLIQQIGSQVWLTGLGG
jgi:hypothetical protein|nr:MAG TPA: hypothetical protein [Siphoviridae sp. ctvzh6]